MEATVWWLASLQKKERPLSTSLMFLETGMNLKHHGAPLAM